MKIKLTALFGTIGVFIAKPVLAHCPLCTIGAGAAAVGASWLGVGNGAIGVFIGAFAVALGLWVSNMLKKQYIPKQRMTLAVFSFITTILPLSPIMKDYSSIYISLRGEYGSLLNRTYLVPLFLVGSILGGIILLLSPTISKKITKMNKDKTLPYQGLAITFILLFLSSVVIQLWL